MSCEKHKRTVEKYPGSLEELAQDIGNLHYEELAKFLHALTDKIEADGEKDGAAGRVQLGKL